MNDQIDWYADRFAEMVKGTATVIKGKGAQVGLAVICLVTEGHLLIEDVPGTGKTALAKTLAALIGGKFGRIQFTPDLLPSDLTGVTIYNQRTQTFEFHQGPVFANVVLADEINRAAPKTQSALLEVMEEQQVSVDTSVYLVPRPFSVIATQNPIEFDGTYRLPEAQLDRFLMRIQLGYPSLEDEVRVFDSGGAHRTVPQVTPVASPEILQSMRSIVDGVEIVAEVKRYILDLAHATRNTPDLRLGVSTRGVLSMAAAARALAGAQRRAYVTPDDIKTLAVPVWAHRCVLTPDAEFHGRTAGMIITELLATNAVHQSAGRQAATHQAAAQQSVTTQQSVTG